MRKNGISLIGRLAIMTPRAAAAKESEKKSSLYRITIYVMSKRRAIKGGKLLLLYVLVLLHAITASNRHEASKIQPANQQHHLHNNMIEACSLRPTFSLVSDPGFFELSELCTCLLDRSRPRPASNHYEHGQLLQPGLNMQI